MVSSPKAGQVLVQMAGSALNPVDLIKIELLESVLLWQTRNVGPGPVAPRNMPEADTCRSSAQHQCHTYRRLCCACLRFRVNLYSGQPCCLLLRSCLMAAPMPSPLTWLQSIHPHHYREGLETNADALTPYLSIQQGRGEVQSLRELGASLERVLCVVCCVFCVWCVSQ